ncbi:MAG: molecular chaperone DnaK, partial [Nostocales cyanobacterium]
MVRDAESHAEEDRKRREQIDTKNLADSLVYQAEKELRELGDKISVADRTRVEELVENLKSAINQDDFSQIKSVSSELQQLLMKIGSAVYAQAGSTSATTQTSEGEDVIDADFVEN